MLNREMTSSSHLCESHSLLDRTGPMPATPQFQCRTKSGYFLPVKMSENLRPLVWVTSFFFCFVVLNKYTHSSYPIAQHLFFLGGGRERHDHVQLQSDKQLVEINFSQTVGSKVSHRHFLSNCKALHELNLF